MEQKTRNRSVCDDWKWVCRETFAINMFLISSRFVSHSYPTGQKTRCVKTVDDPAWTTTDLLINTNLENFYLRVHGIIKEKNSIINISIISIRHLFLSNDISASWHAWSSHPQRCRYIYGRIRDLIQVTCFSDLQQVCGFKFICNSFMRIIEKIRNLLHIDEVVITQCIPIHDRKDDVPE